VKVSVVGAGVMGLSVAWACVRAGHAVSVFEQGPVPNPLGASVDQHRLIRRPYGAMRAYMRMVPAAHQAWRRLWDDLGERLMADAATLVLARTEAGWAAESVAALAADGVAFETLSAKALGARFPFLETDGVRAGHLIGEGGILFAGRIVERLAGHLAGRGVAIRARTRVAEVDPERARLTLEGGEAVAADALVIAAGPWTARLLPALALRARPSRQVVVYLDPPAVRAPAWAGAPMVLDIGPRDIGRYIVPPVAGIGIKIGNHDTSQEGDPDRDRDAAPEEAREVRDLLRPLLREADAYRLIEARTCCYTVAPEERFVIEPMGRAWVMAGFSGHGFKFAPLMGEAVADALSGARDPADLTAWAAGR
jgi:glycine/D-amino acid oxidase-like deaminating enzyme